MPQRSKKASSGGSLKQYRRAREDELRHQFAELSPDGVETTDELRLCADRALASVPELERLYLQDGNPVHVWDAILQIDFARRVLGKPIPDPPWVSAYLVCAAEEIMGKAVAYPSGGDRHTPKEPTRNSDGTTQQYSDYFRGLTAAQRRDVVMEALRFKGVKGWNPLAQAHRDLNDEIYLRQIDVQRRNGLSVSAAGRTVKHPQLRKPNDPQRKLRRDRKRLHGGGT